MSRRAAREAALQAMFQIDISESEPESALSFVLQESNVPEGYHEFATRLVVGACTNLPEIDDAIKSVARDWEIERMANVDRSILRLAGFELLFCKDIPGSVAVNEAIEVAKIFSGDESGKFVNGILGALLVKLGRAKEILAEPLVVSSEEMNAEGEAFS